MPLYSLTQSTRSSYAYRVRKFFDWCIGNDIRKPATAAQIADYLDYLREYHGCGRNALQTALSAITRLYRDNGREIDTKHDAIQMVLHTARPRERHHARWQNATGRREPDEPVRWWEH